MFAGLRGFLLSWASGRVQASGHHHSGERLCVLSETHPLPTPCIKHFECGKLSPEVF